MEGALVTFQDPDRKTLHSFSLRNCAWCGETGSTPPRRTVSARQHETGSTRPRNASSRPWSPLHGSLYVCTKCKLVRYCSETCQKKDWKFFHKKECTKRRTYQPFKGPYVALVTVQTPTHAAPVEVMKTLHDLRLNSTGSDMQVFST